MYWRYKLHWSCKGIRWSHGKQQSDRQHPSRKVPHIPTDKLIQLVPCHCRYQCLASLLQLLTPQQGGSYNTGFCSCWPLNKVGPTTLASAVVDPSTRWVLQHWLCFASWGSWLISQHCRQDAIAMPLQVVWHGWAHINVAWGIGHTFIRKPALTGCGQIKCSVIRISDIAMQEHWTPHSK